MKKIVVYVFTILIPLAVGALSGFLSSPGMKEYTATAVKPPLSPPDWLFPVVWSIIYILLGISLGIVLNKKTVAKDAKFITVAFFGLNLAINFLWSIWFFVFNLYTFSFIWILLLIASTIILAMAFYSSSKIAGLLQIPYVLWLIFAAYLNLAVSILN
jgi:tryptophan-rich sensory protein